MTRKWEDVLAEHIKLERGNNIPAELLSLKPAMENFIRDRKGICRVYETEFNLFMLEALKIIETMIGLGFYWSEDELISIVNPLITLLDGSLDFYDPMEEELH
jgi:hypothetical protein